MIMIYICAGILVDNHLATASTYLLRELMCQQIILKVKKEAIRSGTIFHTFEIYWADGQTTTEHSCYIRKVEE